MSASRFVFPVIAILSLHSPVGAESLQIVDGDTLKLGSTSYRLNGIDAPEYGQKGNRSGGGKWCFGKEAVALFDGLTVGRRAKWVEGDQQASEGCPINGKIHSPPWSPRYSQTKTGVDKSKYYPKEKIIFPISTHVLEEFMFDQIRSFFRITVV